MDEAKLTTSVMVHEGLRLKPYTDTAGKISIGYGRNLSDNGISNSEAADMLSSDLQSAIVQAQAQPWWPNVQDSDARARAFCEIVFNMGIGSLATFREALDAAMRSDWDACAEQFLASVWASEVGERANFLAEMIRTDQDATP
jgi:lysozyme